MKKNHTAWNMTGVLAGALLAGMTAQAGFIGWACGGRDDQGGVLLCTTNGVDWHRQGLDIFETNAANAAASASERHVWVAGDAVGGYSAIYHSSDAGASWERQGDALSLPDVPLHKVCAVDERVVWGVGVSGAVARTVNGGMTWQDVSVDGYTGMLQGVTAIDASTAWVSGEPAGTGSVAALFFTQDGGVSWVAQGGNAITNTRHLLGLYALDAQHVWAIGQHEVVLVTANGGGQWDLLFKGVQKDGNEICVLDEQRIWCAFDSHVNWTTNGGLDWSSQNTADYTMDVSTPDGTNIWAVSDGYYGGRIYYSADAGATWDTQAESNTWMGLFTIDMRMKSPGKTLYVSLSSTNPVPPYASWPTAATNIQDAVDASSPGDTVLVHDGVYASGGRAAGNGHMLTNRVTIDKTISVRSVNGAAYTFIRGEKETGGQTNGSSAVRCAWLTNSASLAGFTLLNGATSLGVPGWLCDGSGGGVWCGDEDCIVFNCLLTGNSADYEGGAIVGGQLWNSVLTGNSAYQGGGASRAVLYNCDVFSNSASIGGGGDHCTFHACSISNNTANYGGGTSQSMLTNCILAGNAAYQGGGANGGELALCVLRNNTSEDSGGGVIWGTLENCLLSGNTALQGGGAYGASLANCTLTRNSALSNGGGTARCAINNGIVYDNWPDNWMEHAMTNSCTTPMPEGTGNITNNPLFVNAGSGFGIHHGEGDYRLQASSACINSGAHEPWMFNATDLAGNSRIIGPAPDMGTYEYLLTPTNLVAATNAVGQCLQLTWTAVNGAGGYAVFRATNNIPPQEALATVQGSTFCDGTAQKGVPYYYWVNAHYLTDASVVSAPALGWLRKNGPLGWLLLLTDKTP